MMRRRAMRTGLLLVHATPIWPRTPTRRDGDPKHVTPTEAIDTVPTDPDDNSVLECAVNAGSQTRSLNDDEIGTNPKYDWKRFGDSSSPSGKFCSTCRFTVVAGERVTRPDAGLDRGSRR